MLICISLFLFDTRYILQLLFLSVKYGNVISSGTTSGSTSSATGTTDAQTSQTDAYGNVISGSDSTTQGSAFNSNIPAPLQSQDSGDGVSTQDWITNEKLGIDENNNSY